MPYTAAAPVRGPIPPIISVPLVSSAPPFASVEPLTAGSVAAGSVPAGVLSPQAVSIAKLSSAASARAMILFVIVLSSVNLFFQKVETCFKCCKYRLFRYDTLDLPICQAGNCTVHVEIESRQSVHYGIFQQNRNILSRICTKNTRYFLFAHNRRSFSRTASKYGGSGASKCRVSPLRGWRKVRRYACRVCPVRRSAFCRSNFVCPPP